MCSCFNPFLIAHKSFAMQLMKQSMNQTFLISEGCVRGKVQFCVKKACGQMM